MVQHNVCQLINLNIMACYVFFSIYVSIYFRQMPQTAFEVEKQLYQTSCTCILLWWGDVILVLEGKRHQAITFSPLYFGLSLFPKDTSCQRHFCDIILCPFSNTAFPVPCSCQVIMMLPPHLFLSPVYLAEGYSSCNGSSKPFSDALVVLHFSLILSLLKHSFYSFGSGFGWWRWMFVFDTQTIGQV